MVDDVGGVFIAHRWQGDLFKPYVQGEGIRTLIITASQAGTGAMIGCGAISIFKNKLSLLIQIP
ncbi:MAG: hypothetical protein R2865_04975 [Deinococcales bacterium]